MDIDTNVPMPETGFGRERKYPGFGGHKTSYPFSSMNVGDSVFYPMLGARHIYDHTAYMAASNVARRYSPYRFAGRSVTEDSVLGVRIWRTK